MLQRFRSFRIQILVRLREIKAAGLVPGQPHKTANPAALQHLQPKPSADAIAKQKAEAMAKAEAEAAKAAAEDEEKMHNAQEKGAAFEGASGPSRSSIMAGMCLLFSFTMYLNIVLILNRHYLREFSHGGLENRITRDRVWTGL